MEYLLIFTATLLISLVLFSHSQTQYVPHKVSPAGEVNSLQVKPVDPNGRKVLGVEVQGGGNSLPKADNIVQ